jgi:hypothetical protein
VLPTWNLEEKSWPDLGLRVGVVTSRGGRLEWGTTIARAPSSCRRLLEFASLYGFEVQDELHFLAMRVVRGLRLSGYDDKVLWWKCCEATSTVSQSLGCGDVRCYK